MSYGGTIMTVKDNYMLNYNKYLSCLTREYYDPKFVVNTILNYVKFFTKDTNPYIEEMKQCMTFDNLFEEFCKNNLSVYERYEDNLFSYVERYGKLMKILNKVPEKKYRNIYNLRQWICQAKYICNKLQTTEYNIELEIALVVYYIKANQKISVAEAYDILISHDIFGDISGKTNVNKIDSIINGDKKSVFMHNIFMSSITLPPAACDLIFHSVNCFINKRTLEKSTYISFINKISKYRLSKNQENPVYKAVFSLELQQEQNIIARERHKILNCSKNKFGYWLSDRSVLDILLTRYTAASLDHGEIQKRINERLSRARRLGLASDIGYIPIMEFLTILECMNGLNNEHYDVIYAEFIHTALAKYGFNITDSDVKYYLKKLAKHKIDDDILEVVYYSQFDTPPIELSDWAIYFRQHALDGKMALCSKERCIRELTDEATQYIKGKHPVQKSVLYEKAYAKELQRAMTHVWKPLIYNKGAINRVDHEITRFDNIKKNSRRDIG